MASPIVTALYGAAAWLLMPFPEALAGDAARGEALFAATCRVCHGPNSHPGREATRPAAYRPDVIAEALVNVAAMRPFASLYAAGDLDDIATYLGTVFVVPPEPSTGRAVEYHHSDFDHYFVTAIAEEIVRLDRGDFAGWTRTGGGFQVHTATSPASSWPVCRFFSAAFAPRSSHFYTALPEECAQVRGNASWTFEGHVFQARLPAADGACVTGTTPVYRLYNDGQGGAPNHRFTTRLDVREAMLARRWVSEGWGALGIALCVAGP